MVRALLENIQSVASLPATWFPVDEPLANDPAESDSVLLRVTYGLRFEILFTLICLTLWVVAGSVKRRWLADEKRKSKAIEVSTPTSPSVSPVPPSRTPAPTRRNSGAGATQIATHAGIRILKRGAGPEEVIRSYEASMSRIRQAGEDALGQLSTDGLSDLYSELFSAAVRTGRALKLPTYIKDGAKFGLVLTAQQLESIVKMCTAKKHFSEAIAAFEAFEYCTDLGSTITGSTWSCLLFCSVEACQFGRCETFYKSLRTMREPSSEDFMNMLRYIVHNKSMTRLRKLLQEVRNLDHPPDNITYNRALAICVSAEQLDMAEELLTEMREHENVCDVITHNTLIKGYAVAGKIDKCFELHADMQRYGITPSEVTFGILLDACVSGGQFDRAARIFEDFQKSGCALNAVLYTTLLKGLARAGELEQAMRVFEQMCSSNISPDLVSFSVLIKVHCDAGKIETALELLDRMLRHDLQPDEIVFNNLLLGCAERRSKELGGRIFEDMQRQGLKPSHVTLSIMVKILVRCHDWDGALDLLETSPQKLGLQREARLYVQLVQASIRDRQGRRVMEVCKAMMQHSKTDESTNTRLVMQCASFNMYDTGADLLDTIVKSGGRVNPNEMRALLTQVVKKRKSNAAKSILASMQYSQIPIDAELRAAAIAIG